MSFSLMFVGNASQEEGKEGFFFYNLFQLIKTYKADKHGW